MRDFHHTEHFTVFGGSYVSENHGHGAVLKNDTVSRLPQIRAWAGVLSALAVGITSVTMWATASTHAALLR
jgi:hypothetical protein